MCGGNQIRSDASLTPPGLSPLVRGKHDQGDFRRESPGSIPACAGETKNHPGRRWGHRVYPRLCGGNRLQYLTHQQRAGLSPLVRGKRRSNGSIKTRTGSIPACAGETESANVRAVTNRVYPRLCGGNTTKPESIYHYVGLSPLVRGKRLKDNRDKFFAGSIPACAGETIDGGPRHKMRWVYPRLCGGNHQRRGSGELALGLSPLVRGKHR